MEITRKNYEAYFVDYLEGKLDEKLVDQFLEFLEQNPDLKEELKLFESGTVVPEDTTFTKKNKLYKEKYDLEDAFNSAAIARLEGDIGSKEKREFDAYLSKHPDKQNDVRLFSKTILKADEKITFVHKNRLYRKPGRKVVLFWAGRVAAVLILALAIFGLMERNNKPLAPDNQVARVEEKAAPKNETSAKNQPPETSPAAEEATASTQAAKDAPVKKSVIKPAPKKIVPEKKETKSIRENHRGRLPDKELVAEREPIEVPGQLQTLTASMEVPQPHANLGIMTLVYPPLEEEEHLLADNLKGKISLQKITKAGLNLVNSISNDRFTYETNDEGKVTEYNYESRLLAFSIPSSKPDEE